MSFVDLRLSEPLLRAVNEAGYREPTPIQTATIPQVLAGRDIVASAQTGTGKTAAFALPILQRFVASATNPPKRSKVIRALTLCPTRELAQQIMNSFRTYGKHTSLKYGVVFGGVNQGPQARFLRDGVDVLVATPGRLLDLLNQGLVSLDAIEVLVLDEADRMFDMGFLPDLRKILARLPRERQTLLFSATMPPAIRELANKILRNPVPVQVSRVSSVTPTVDHWVHHVEKPAKPALLLKLLGQSPRTRTLVFTRTKHGADKVASQLLRVGVSAAAIHGNKSQGARTRALADFKSAESGVLVATDLAARGLDVHDISHVINYDLTSDPETYIHRVGRAGRAGAKGIAISFCTSEDRDDLRSIERLLQKPLQRAAAIAGNDNIKSVENRGSKPAPAKRPVERPRNATRAHVEAARR